MPLNLELATSSKESRTVLLAIYEFTDNISGSFYLCIKDIFLILYVEHYLSCITIKVRLLTSMPNVYMIVLISTMYEYDISMVVIDNKRP